MVARFRWYGERFGVNMAMPPLALYTKASARYGFLMPFRRYGGLSCAEPSVRRPATKDRLEDD